MEKGNNWQIKIHTYTTDKNGVLGKFSSDICEKGDAHFNFMQIIVRFFFLFRFSFTNKHTRKSNFSMWHIFLDFCTKQHDNNTSKHTDLAASRKDLITSFVRGQIMKYFTIAKDYSMFCHHSIVIKMVERSISWSDCKFLD